MLLNRLGIRFNVETMHGHLRIEARHVFIAQAKTSIYSRMRDIRSYFSVGNRFSLIEMSFECAWSPTSTWITLSSVLSLHWSKHFSYWRSNCWAHGSASNGSKFSSCSIWLIDVMLVKCFLKTTPTVMFDVIGQWLLQWLNILLVEQEISKIILHFFEQLHFSEYRSDHNIILHIFEALVQRERDNPVAMDPWSSE